MGNCTGIFSSCKGDDGAGGVQEAVIKKIDKDQMQRALAHNNQEINGNFGNSKQPQHWNQAQHNNMIGRGQAPFSEANEAGGAEFSAQDFLR